jgi:predicted dehydrogenase
MEKVRVAIVGSRFAADFHCDAYRRNEQAELVAVASPTNPEGIASKWRIPHVYHDYRLLLQRDDIELVSVCAPNFLHHEVVLAAAGAGKNVVCEKPLATTAEEGGRMVEACGEHGVKLMYAEDWCFAPALRRLRAIIEEGGIGRVLYVKARECHNGSHSPYAKKRSTCGGGSFIHLAVHPLGYLLYLLGRGENPVVEVSGHMSGGGEANLVHKEFEGEDFGLGTLRFAGGELGFVEGNYITVGGMDDRVEVYGSEGRLTAELTFGSPILCYSRPGISYSIEKTDHNLGWTRPAVDEFYNLGYVEELRYFVECVRTGREPFYGVDGRAGLACLQLVEAFYRSSEEGRTVQGSWS